MNPKISQHWSEGSNPPEYVVHFDIVSNVATVATDTVVFHAREPVAR
jgi:hypothetical protein